MHVSIRNQFNRLRTGYKRFTYQNRLFLFIPVLQFFNCQFSHLWLDFGRPYIEIWYGIWYILKENKSCLVKLLRQECKTEFCVLRRRSAPRQVSVKIYIEWGQIWMTFFCMFKHIINNNCYHLCIYQIFFSICYLWRKILL